MTTVRGFAVLSLLSLLACSVTSTSSSGGGGGGGALADAGADGSTTALPTDAGADAAIASGACAVLPATATNAGSGCSGVPGTFTAITFDTAANTYVEACSAPAPYPDQATFDLNEGTSVVASVTISSNEDYVVTPTCASGSVEYTPLGGTRAKIVFFWTKVP